ncbi:hypothetical protein HA466_0095340 [Hirschfeldia incana]|nr:hypothetical protein HA466_0095340 [Hirschfeldia incana]
MQKIGFPAMKSLDQIRSMAAGSAKNLSSFSSRQPHDSVSSGNFSNLKFTAEKLVKEQASMKSDLELANSKLKKSKDQILALEEKLQNPFNENAKLRVMQKEDDKLWRGMESKFSSTKTLCDQLTETLQHLASQVQEAEKDKELFESKFSTSAEAIDSLKQQMQDLSLRLRAAEENIKSREKELEELRLEKEQRENSYLSEQCKTASLLNEKDVMITNSEAAIAEAKANIQNLNFQIVKVRLELTSKEDEAKCLVGVKEKLEQEKKDIQTSADNLYEKLVSSDEEVKKLEGFVHSLATELVELDKKNLAFMGNFDKLNALYGTHLLLLQKDKDLASDRAQRLFNQLQGEFLTVTFQKEALQASENKTEELMLKLSSSEFESKENYEKLHADAQRKAEEMEILQRESQSNQLRVDSLSEEVNQLKSVIEEKELCIQQCKENEKKLDQKATEDKELLAAAETKLVEAKKQYTLMLENKQLELSKQVKELSQRNDQAINDIRRKYDEEKHEIINAEKEKVEKVIKELSTKYDQELSDCKTESKQQLLTMQGDHASLILTIRKEHENREFNLKAKHDEELRKTQIQAETELTERITTLRNEQDVQLKAFKCQYEEECKKLQEELSSKIKRREAKSVVANAVEGYEYSVTSGKVRAPRPASRRNQHTTVIHDGDEHDSPFVKAAETPVTKKVENTNMRSLMSSQQRHSKVARRGYEVETNDGRTTKRRKTGGTVKFEEPKRRSTRLTPKAKTPRSIAKVAAIRSNPPRSANNLGDLFSEGSLNPYADDPYAFD